MSETGVLELENLARREQEFAADILRALKRGAQIAPLKQVAIASAVFQKALGDSTREGKLAQALARGITVREQMATEEGGSMSAEEAGRYLNASKQTVLNLYHGKKLLGWRTEKQGAIRLPVWQFVDHQRLPGLDEVLALLDAPRMLDDWGRIGFFLQTHVILQDRRPLDLLREKQLGEVLKAAAAYVE